MHSSFYSLLEAFDSWPETLTEDGELDSKTKSAVNTEVNILKKREAAGRRAEQGECRMACETKRREVGTGVTARPEWTGRENKEGLSTP